MTTTTQNAALDMTPREIAAALDSLPLEVISQNKVSIAAEDDGTLTVQYAGKAARFHPEARHGTQHWFIQAVGTMIGHSVLTMSEALGALQTSMNGMMEEFSLPARDYLPGRDFDTDGQAFYPCHR